MDSIEEKFVYHGSEKKFDQDMAVPRENKRVTVHEDGTQEVKFEGISFHATPHKWIALAYTYDPKPYQIDGKTAHYGMGVSLFQNNKKIAIYGFESLEKSLEKLYGDGGFVYHFDKEKFYYTEGLGNLEVITDKPIKPDVVERIDNPLEELRKLGVKFEFIDLGKPENEGSRNYSL